MNTLLTIGMGIVAAASLLGLPGEAATGQDAPPAWSEFAGYWRVDPTVAEQSPTSAFRLHITVEGDELAIERHGFALTETSRYRLDGRPAPTVQDARPVEASAALEAGGLVIRTKATLPDGRVSNITETYLLQRRITMMMTIDRTTTVGTRTTNSRDLLRRLPSPRLLHPDNQP